MIRVTFVNEAGKIEYNPELQAIQLSFDGTGDYQQHVKTLNIAADLAKLYHVFSFLLCQQRFASLTPHAFKQLIFRWLRQLPEAFGEQQFEHAVHVYLIVSPEALLKVSEIQQELDPVHEKFVVFHAFASMQEFEEFQMQSLNSLWHSFPFLPN